MCLYKVYYRWFAVTWFRWIHSHILKFDIFEFKREARGVTVRTKWAVFTFLSLHIKNKAVCLHTAPAVTLCVSVCYRIDYYTNQCGCMYMLDRWCRRGERSVDHNDSFTVTGTVLIIIISIALPHGVPPMDVSGEASPQSTILSMALSAPDFPVAYLSGTSRISPNSKMPRGPSLGQNTRVSPPQKSRFCPASPQVSWKNTAEGGPEGLNQLVPSSRICWIWSGI